LLGFFVRVNAAFVALIATLVFVYADAVRTARPTEA
jgi:hypothetical protein